jgi:hypothetical protein
LNVSQTHSVLSHISHVISSSLLSSMLFLFVERLFYCLCMSDVTAYQVPMIMCIQFTIPIYAGNTPSFLCEYPTYAGKIINNIYLTYVIL